MNIYIARQPIFDRRNNIFAYELLFRKNSDNFFTPMDDDLATAEIIYNAFLGFGIDNLTDGSMATINFSKGLLESDLLELLPKDKIIVEILERGKTTQDTLDACRKFKRLGYTLAVDDFALEEDNLPLLDVVDIVKVEYPAVSFLEQAALIKKYRNKVKFLAEKIETREQYGIAVRLGYSLFQGYFFSKPIMMHTKDIGLSSASLFRVIDELNAANPSYKKIADIVQLDLGLSYKLLKLVNSAYIAPRNEIRSIQQALNFLGTKELYQWISLMMLKDVQAPDNAEMVKQSLIRGKLMAILAKEYNLSESVSEYFFAGIFSQIDAILGTSLSDVLAELPLSDLVKDALLGSHNNLRNMLDCIICFETGDWDELNATKADSILDERFMKLYMDTVTWVKNVSNC